MKLTTNWRQVWEELPAAFSWARGILQGRQPLLERAELVGNRIAWSVRLPLYGDQKRLTEAGFSCREGDAVSKTLPQEIAWLATTFGDCFVETDCSGTAPWGVRLGSVRDRMFDGA